jgi:hypothetical protein
MDVDLINDILLELTQELDEFGFIPPEDRIIDQEENVIRYGFKEKNAVSKIKEEDVVERLKHKSLNYSVKLTIENQTLILTISKK